jgi:hypothetical protein
MTQESLAPTNWKLSQLLKNFLNQHQKQQVCLQDLLHLMGDRAFAPTLLLCALPEALPLPVAGISALVAVPLMLVSVQLIVGFRKPWLPKRIIHYSFQRHHLEKLVDTAIHPLEILERLLKPRWPLFTQPFFVRLTGIVLLLLAGIVALPIPFGNMLPAMVIVLICLGMIERDGCAIALSAICTIAMITFFTSVMVAVVQSSPEWRSLPWQIDLSQLNL